MTHNQNLSTTRGASGRSRGLFWIVVAGTIVMVLLGTATVALLVRGKFLQEYVFWAGQDAVPVTQLQLTQDQATFLQSQQAISPVATPVKDNDHVKPTASATAVDVYLIQPKEVITGSTINRPRWTATPLPTPSPSPTPSPIPTFVSDDSYSSLLRPEAIGDGEKWIDVNLTSQTLVAFEGSAPVFQSLVSSGTANHPTVTGQFRIWLRFASQDMNGRRLGYDYFLKNVPYVQYFYQDYALHGTFWHNNFGTPMSHGCVNLPTPSAEWLYNWASNGTLVNVHN